MADEQDLRHKDSRRGSPFALLSEDGGDSGGSIPLSVGDFRPGGRYHRGPGAPTSASLLETFRSATDDIAGTIERRPDLEEMLWHVLAPHLMRMQRDVAAALRAPR